MKERPRIVINDTKPMLHMLRRLQNQYLFDGDEQYRSKMYKIIEEPF